MPLLSDAVRKQAAGLFDRLAGPVRLVLFTREADCLHCREARTLVEEVAGLSKRLSLEVHDLVRDRAEAERYRVDRVPALCVVGARDYGIRYYGVPGGYEFTSLVSAIELASTGDSGLRPETRRRLVGLDRAVDVSVFVTLTCPYCPMAVMLAHRLAVESDFVTGAAVDAAEFPQLASRHNVMAVPKTVVDGGHSFEGVLPEDRFVDQVLQGVSGKPQD